MSSLVVTIGRCGPSNPPMWRSAFVVALLATHVGCAGEDGPDTSIGPIPADDTVERVEVTQYLGTWYEIATIRQGFQANCRNTTATYGAIDAETVSVDNRCIWGANPISLEGTARILDPASNARLEVDLGFGKAPYWIVDLGLAEAADPYPWAAVSSPDRGTLWILSRDKKMPQARYDAIYERLADRGFGPERMELTEQD